MGYLAFNLSSKYLQFSKFSVRDIAPRDRYRAARSISPGDMGNFERYRAARSISPGEMGRFERCRRAFWQFRGRFERYKMGAFWKFGQGSRLPSGVGFPARCFSKSLKLLPLHFGDAWHSINKSSTYSDYFQSMIRCQLFGPPSWEWCFVIEKRGEGKFLFFGARYLSKNTREKLFHKFFLRSMLRRDCSLHCGLA